MTRLKSIAAVAAVAVVLLVLGAAPAQAHANLEATDPPASARLGTAPRSVTLTFSEPVDVGAGSIRVFDGNGRRADGGGQPTHLNGRGNQVSLPLSPVRDGVYVVTWRVISADSHPVHGAFTFTVGNSASPGSTDSGALASSLVASQGGSRVVGVVYGIVRFAAFIGLVVLVGGGMFLLGLWPAGVAAPRARRLLLVGWLLAVVSTMLGLAVQGLYGAGLPLGDIVRWSVLRGVLSTRFGHAWLVRLAALLAAGPFLLRAVRQARARTRSQSRLLTSVLAALAIVVVVTPGFAGHAGADHPAALAVAVDALHLAAVCFWLGGMAMLLLVDLAGVGNVIERYSRLAVVAVIVILATGVFAGWRQTRELDAVTATTYGRLLLVKLALFVAMLVFAGFSRSWVRRRRALQTAPATGALRRSVGAEALLGVTVLVATSLLVNTVPGRDALAKPFSTELRAGPVLVDVTVDPAKAGPVDVHVYTLTPTGQVTEVAEMFVQLSLPARGVGPLDVPVQRAGPGHFAAYGFVVPLRGTWRLSVSARTSDIDQATATTTIRIR
jgi:copper transport protein